MQHELTSIIIIYTGMKNHCSYACEKPLRSVTMFRQWWKWMCAVFCSTGSWWESKLRGADSGSSQIHCCGHQRSGQSCICRSERAGGSREGMKETSSRMPGNHVLCSALLSRQCISLSLSGRGDPSERGGWWTVVTGSHFCCTSLSQVKRFSLKGSSLKNENCHYVVISYPHIIINTN